MEKEFVHVIKYLQVNDLSKKIEKSHIHKLIDSLKNKFQFNISSLIINFISADQITKINKEYLNHNFSTDVITFNYSGSNDILDGEVFISTSDAEYYSRKNKINYSDEIKRLVIHGILHLLGYDDQNKTEKRVMKRIENKLIQEYKINLLKKE